MLNRMKKDRTVVAVALVVALMAACSSGSKTDTGAGGPVQQIDFWGGWTGPDRDVMDGMVKEFNSSHPKIQVTLTTVQWTPLFNKFVTSSRAGTVPDLLAMHQPDTTQFVKLGAGLLEPLDSKVKDMDLGKADFATPAWNGTFVDGKQYAVPLDLHMHGLYANVDLLKASGLDPTKLPKTGAELIDVATKLTIDEKGKHPNEAGFNPKAIKQYGLSLYQNHHAFYMWYALMAQQGEGLLNATRTGTSFDDAKGAAAWKFLQDLVFVHRVAPEGETAPSKTFLSGKAALLIDGPWQLPAMAQQQGLNFATAPFPQVFEKPATWGSGHELTLPKQKDKAAQAAALTLAEWIVKNSQKWANAGHVPALKSVKTAVEKLPGRTAFVGQLGVEVLLPSITQSAQMFSSDATSPIVQAAQAAMVKRVAPADVVASLRAAMDALLTSP